VITIDNILSAQERIAPFIWRTPVLPAMQMRDRDGHEGRVTLKLEPLQGFCRKRGFYLPILGMASSN
jgi:threonine dehydratase